MSWKQSLVDLMLSSGSVILPEDWKRKAITRLQDFNPYCVIATNQDLLRAARLAWVKAALEMLDTVKESAQSSGMAFDQKNGILRFEAIARQSLIKIRSDALDRCTHPGDSPIDHHLETTINGASEFISPGENRSLVQPLTLGFDQTIAAITGWPVHEIPAMFKQIARDGLPTVDQGEQRRPFGELVFAAFAEILKNPDQYPEAGAAFTIAMQNAARKLSDEILAIVRGIDEKVDALIEQTQKSNPAVSEKALVARYREQCIVAWSQPIYKIDKQFTPLTLLLDRGDDTQGDRYQPQDRTYYDLREILNAVDPDQTRVIVVTGGPGSGKSTLLRRLELDLARQALDENGDAEDSVPLTLFRPLNAFGQDGRIPEPYDWLAAHWTRVTDGLLDFKTLFQKPLILLLDGLNEMPRAGLMAWKNFLNDLVQHHQNVCVIFSCRTRDYGSQLTTKELPRVPQVEITPLDDTQVEKFLQVYSPDTAAHLWDQLKGSEQLDLYRSPYYLKLLIDQTSDGQIPEGRAALFTGFVRAMLAREMDNTRLRNADWLLTQRDLKHIGKWRDAYELPGRGVLFNALADFAFQLQTQRSDGDTENTGNKMQVRIDIDDALDCLSTHVKEESQREYLLDAAVDLQILDMPGDDVLFVHQLLQEYFAARHLAAHLNTAQKANDANQSAELVKLAAAAWLEADILPTVQEELAILPRSGTLSDLPTTGWEETFMLTAAMTDAPDGFLHTLAQINLPLAWRCAAQPDVKVSDELRRDVQQRLVARSRDPATDLRARIHAGDALGRLGDPRFEPRQGKHNRYVLPPMVEIEGGIYSIGSDKGIADNESPRHDVELEPFALGQFPVTNAEFKCFIDAGGYDDERWWDTLEAQRWRRGEGTGEAGRENLRNVRDQLKNDATLFSKAVEELA
ncbi:MAG: SUMF1/EgtB/PvdO family nonheme iron enzyme [Burkholderiales bacterium]|nr:SUMF1/EgtB/PvdO family nonheme iron enzyme [Burkholderiales bacterium]MDR4516210.1 SUMF1/EgtB/PvdO family nonheme iron enzyme [Nitrosomonas sp.]